jgi:hypothetical protein
MNAINSKDQVRRSGRVRTLVRVLYQEWVLELVISMGAVVALFDVFATLNRGMFV